eukprot:CAMPEP_0181199216 /NCGR_PEP_ID=MMETSP1096-20121128/17053_1 /TAXON_ID=156174 ORGANISM="Chrysochromulina ericina, Strain CCMP281" /NCGR_SAMPLE_ID=MMETSP1096 /ASSEMBLY_ACC=CAM_ASM_000453 /LENGTH=137 /DNA_ID=CAMNT_0023289373 /DNA_START=606 /DNA_END=1019 /DNA_ORIENTATION=-
MRDMRHREPCSRGMTPNIKPPGNESRRPTCRVSKIGSRMKRIQYRVFKKRKALTYTISNGTGNMINNGAGNTMVTHQRSTYARKDAPTAMPTARSSRVTTGQLPWTREGGMVACTLHHTPLSACCEDTEGCVQRGPV